MENDEDDFWEEQYDLNYHSKLDDIGEIADFRRVMELLAREQPGLYQGLISHVENSELVLLNEKMNRAIRFIEEKADLDE